MAGVAGRTVIKFEESADLIIQKGSATVALHPDGSIYVNNVKVTDAAIGETAAPVELPSPPPVTVIPDTIAVPPAPAVTDTTPPAVIHAAPDTSAIDAARTAAIKKALAERKSPLEASQAGQEAAAKATAMLLEASAPAIVPADAPTTTPLAPENAVAPAETAVAPIPAADVMRVGQTIDDKGVFIGSWKPCGTDGQSLGKIFNVFAAPEDLTDDKGDKVLLAFNKAAQRVAELKDWHGHDGGNFENDAALYKSLRKDKYNGEWFIPPMDIIVASDGKSGMLYQAKDAGDLDETFKKVSGSPASQWYWSSTETPEDKDYVQFARFAGEGKLVDYMGRDYNKLATRPVRIEPRP